MRHINRDRLEELLPTGWIEEAQQAQEEVRAVYETPGQTDEERRSSKSAMIKKHGGIWSKAKSALKQLSHNKCWYCETSLERMLCDVDHFRPKNRVNECKDHDGYWWLAFVVDNYRLCCEKCNRRLRDASEETVGGKGDHFPLIDEKRRVYKPGSVRQEGPQLLDPVVATEPGFLWFDQNGKVLPKPDLLETSRQRAEKSIELYHLYEVELEEARRTKFREIKELVDAGDDLYQPAQSSDVAATGYNLVFQKLHRMIQPQAEYSASARCMLMGLRGEKRPWIDALFQTN